MNQNLIVGIVVVAVVVLGGGYALSRTATAPSTSVTTGTQQTAETAATAGKFTGSFAELGARSGSWKCTVDSSTAASISSGSVYAADGKVRADFTSSVPGYGSAETHLVVDGEYVYTWSSLMPQGIKTKVTATPQAGTAPTSGQSISPDLSYSYDCQPWANDASVFALPSNVTFKSY